MSTLVGESPRSTWRANLFPGLRVGLAISIAINLALVAALFGHLSLLPGPLAGSAFTSNAWYAVFVNSLNQEAFVGHVSEATASDMTMKDIYYLTFEAKDASGNPIASPKPEDIKPVIKKLGQEVYGPRDYVKVNRLNLRYYTELRDDSQVVKAIRSFELAGSKSNPSR